MTNPLSMCPQWFKGDVKVHGLFYDYPQCYLWCSLCKSWLTWINANSNCNNNTLQLLSMVFMLDTLTANLHILHILCSDLIEILARFVMFLQFYRAQRIQDTQPERAWARTQTQVCLLPRAGLYSSLPLLGIWEDQSKLQYKKGMPFILAT